VPEPTAERVKVIELAGVGALPTRVTPLLVAIEKLVRVDMGAVGVPTGAMTTRSRALQVPAQVKLTRPRVVTLPFTKAPVPVCVTVPAGATVKVDALAGMAILPRLGKDGLMERV
jgi:hypothetical protein